MQTESILIFVYGFTFTNMQIAKTKTVLESGCKNVFKAPIWHIYITYWPCKDGIYWSTSWKVCLTQFYPSNIYQIHYKCYCHNSPQLSQTWPKTSAGLLSVFYCGREEGTRERVSLVKGKLFNNVFVSNLWNSMSNLNYTFSVVDNKPSFMNELDPNLSVHRALTCNKPGLVKIAGWNWSPALVLVFR